MGTKQLVVQLALETTRCLAGSKVSSLTPTTKVASTLVAAVEMMTRLAPASIWAAAFSPSVNRPVDSITTSAPTSPHGTALGSFSENTLKLWGPTAIVSSDTFTSCGRRPKVESYFSR